MDILVCENKWCLLKHSNPGAAVWDGDEIHLGGESPLQAKSQPGVQDVNAECRVLGMHRYSPQMGLMLCR